MKITRRSLGRALAGAGAVTSAAITAHTAYNVRKVQIPVESELVITERVSILLPARNEAARIAPTVESLLAQKGIAELEILILDDGSTDGTAEVIREACFGDPRVKIIDGGDDDLPMGWLGKTWACHRLSLEATGDVLVFVDADVVLRPGAVASAIHMMRARGLEIISPYPTQIAITPAERLTQPLINWSWMALIPIGPAENSPFASLSAAVGQFIVVDAGAYRAIGGHSAVANNVLDDVAIMRAFKKHGFRGLPVNGSRLAQCRMYTSSAEIVEGYTKNVGAVFGSAAGIAGILGVMAVGFVLPPVFAVMAEDRRTRMWGVLGYASSVTGRWIVARKTGERVWPDSLTQPASIAAFGSLAIESYRRRRKGIATWRGRTLPQ
jgi:glycosyltransferase involved in cell wall biosynthesis